MAVKINFTSKAGEEGNYVNFQPQFRGKSTILLKMKYWKNKTIRDAEGSLPFNERVAGANSERIVGFKCLHEFEYDLESADNVFIQGYKHLKSLPEFGGAVDC